jgi:hypothetical protein
MGRIGFAHLSFTSTRKLAPNGRGGYHKYTVYHSNEFSA